MCFISKSCFRIGNPKDKKTIMKYPLCEHIFFTTEIVNSKFIKYVLKIFLKEQSENIFKINEKVFLKMMGAGKDLLGVEEENTQM